MASDRRIAQLRDQIAFRARALPIDRQRIERSMGEVLTDLTVQHKAFCELVAKLEETLTGRAAHVRALMVSSLGEAQDLSRERSDAFDTYLSLNHTLSAYQTVELQSAEQKLHALTSRMLVLRREGASLDETERELADWREELALLEAGYGSPTTARAARPAKQGPTAWTEEQVKAIRAQARRDEWDHLPVFHGTGDVTQRDCLHCGAPVPGRRKRFCSVDCHRMHMEAFASATRPARHSGE